MRLRGRVVNVFLRLVHKNELQLLPQAAGGKGEKAAPMRGVRGQPEKGAVPVGHALGGTAGCGIEGGPAVGGPQQGGEAEIPLPPGGGQQLTVSPPLIKG